MIKDNSNDKIQKDNNCENYRKRTNSYDDYSKEKKIKKSKDNTINIHEQQ